MSAAHFFISFLLLLFYFLSSLLFFRGAAGRRGFVARGVVLGDHRLGLARDAETEPARASFLARGRQQPRLSGVEHQSGEDLGDVGFFGGETDNDLAEDGVWEVADEVDAFFLVFFLRHRALRNVPNCLLVSLPTQVGTVKRAHNSSCSPMEGIPILHISVVDLSALSYNKLMDDIGGRFQRRAHHNFRNVPITSNEEGWHIISLDMPESPSVQILIDQRNAYLIAIRNGAGQWFNFSDTPAPDIFNAQPILYLKADYGHLLQDWDEVTVGPPSVLDSYYRLLNFNNGLPRDHPLLHVQRRAIARLAVMFCEAARLRSVRALVSHQMDLYMNGTITSLITRKRITSWDLISGFALHCWSREQDGIGGYLQTELDKLRRIGIYAANHVAGEPDGELLLILYRQDVFANLQQPAQQQQ
uniref:rRNA N-glycosylase n=2 Tax=Oryza TaxID=4527 RepID=Q2QPB9_ORYSJ|nr:Ribosome inactivating protein [Oryza sativa Japonica Group]